MDIVTYALLNGKIKNYASNVDEWLEENVDPTTGYVLDRSLQMENAAAPADMVGDINDEVGDLKNTFVSHTIAFVAPTQTKIQRIPSPAQTSPPPSSKSIAEIFPIRSIDIDPSTPTIAPAKKTRSTE